MSAVWFIFVVAMLNTGLGFAIAVHLGRRYRSMADAEADWDFDDELTFSGTPENPSSSEPTTEADAAPAAAVTEPGVEQEEKADESPSPAPGDEMELPVESGRAEPGSEWAAEAAGPSGLAPAGETELTSEPQPAHAELDALGDAVSKPSAPTPDAATEGISEPRLAGADGRPEDDASGPTGSPPTAEADNVGRSGGEKVLEQDDQASEPSDRAVSMQRSEQDALEAARRADGGTIDSERGAEGLAPPPRDDSSVEKDRTSPTNSAAADSEGRSTQGAVGIDGSDPMGSELGPVTAGETDSDTSARKMARPTQSEEALEAFLSEVEQYQEQLGEADGSLRSQAGNPDGESIRACLQSLFEASRDYVERREDARERLQSVRGELPEFNMACEKLNGACGRQDEQIESTERAIAAFPYTDDLTRGCRVMIDETTKLMDANVAVRDALHEVDVAFARGENRLADLDPRKRSDALTGAESRGALENTLLQWMKEETSHTKTLTLAAIDVDEFGQVNREFGHAVGNQLLHALGQLFVGENRSQGRLARFSGERFVMLFPNSDLRKTTNTIERLRQIVEAACFSYKKSDIRITVSCGVAEAIAGDTPETILARAEATLMEAKRYGRNRTFIHEGKYPTPVVPPKFSIEQRRMAF